MADLGETPPAPFVLEFEQQPAKAGPSLDDMMGQIFASMSEAGGRVEEPPAPTPGKRTHKRGATAAAAQADQVQVKASDAKALASEVVGFANLVVVGNIGPECAINPVEETLIVSSLAKLLHTSDVFARAAQVTNPIALIVGLGMWGYRISMVWQEKHPRKARPERGGGVGRPPPRGRGGWGSRGGDNVTQLTQQGDRGIASSVPPNLYPTAPDNPANGSSPGAPLGPEYYGGILSGMALGQGDPSAGEER